VRGEETAVPLHGRSVLRFATVEQGRTVLATEDLFAQSLSRFDRESRLASDRNPATRELLDFAAEQVRPWSEDDVERITTAIASVSTKLAPLADVLPEEILLIHTTGREEADAAYTRGRAIILPTKKARLPVAQLERLLAHELFHVLSRHDAELRRRLYAIVGFTPCPPIELPEPLRERKITNPDAPAIDCTIELSIGDRKALCAPILTASIERYDPKQGGGFFKYLEFHLLEVERSGEELRPVIKDGNVLLHEPKRLDDYFAQIGRNTGYIIHPDEILADNFVHLLTGKQDLETPRIVAAMREVLTPP
jgi:hypothetical protein